MSAQTKSPLRKISLAELERHGGTISGNAYWTVIDGYVYDVTLWRDAHPGGKKMIETISGRDGTPFIETYHNYKNKSKVMSVLKSKLSNYIVGEFVPQETEKNYEIMNIKYTLNSCEFYNVLSKRVDDYFNKHNISYKGSEWNCLYAVVIYLLQIWSFIQMWYDNPYYLQIFYGLLNGVLCLKMGHIMHTGNHYGYKTKLANDVFSRYMNLLGLSRNWWILKHNILHHVAPNHSGIDSDVASGAPFFRLHCSQKLSWYHKYQHLYAFPSMITLYYPWYFVEYINGIIFGLIRDPTIDSNAEPRFEKFGKNFHLLVNGAEYISLIFCKIYVLMMHIGFKVLLVEYENQSSYFLTSVVSLSTFGFLNGFIFILNHVQSDLDYKLNKENNFIYLNVLNTSNWSSGSIFWQYVTGGLNHQIEHHLFPSLHPKNYPLISNIVKKTCLEYGLVYADHGNFIQSAQNCLNYLYIMGHN